MKKRTVTRFMKKAWVKYDDSGNIELADGERYIISDMYEMLDIVQKKMGRDTHDYLEMMYMELLEHRKLCLTYDLHPGEIDGVLNRLDLFLNALRPYLGERMKEGDYKAEGLLDMMKGVEVQNV